MQAESAAFEKRRRKYGLKTVFLQDEEGISRHEQLHTSIHGFSQGHQSDC
ncbi:hypothetical protein HMPREF9135_1629 [Segatella baroniae F0067]|uniref:Uncharacterized protein n=1 Tax=Segatella baroniae F0067 TaxID=1115809 RepID=U2P6Z8_9BACT|nr:hypothetical protein HMPREF9135_1629 [Segatella baroniae F0067]